LGNELVGNKGIESHINVTFYLQDWNRLINVLDEIYDGNRYGEFLSLVDDSKRPDIVTHHLYSLGAGNDPNMWKKTLNATYLNQIATLAKEVQETVSKTSPTSKIYIGEAGGAYNSGGDNVTNAFNSGFWFLDQMGIFAAYGHGAYCRQALVGGFYSLLDPGTYEPNPDYYSLLLWSRLMGTRVLATTTSGDGNLRAYTHCALGIPGGVTLLLINLSNITMFDISDISLVGSGKNIMSYGSREEYILSSASTSTNETDILQSRKMLLNGELLEVYGDSEIPSLSPVVMEKQSTINMNPLTYGFFVFPDAQLSVCY
jgi:heparanase 1